jgi:hypothetical protein
MPEARRRAPARLQLARILNETSVSSTIFSGQANLFFLQARLTRERKGKWCDEEDNANG